MATPIPSNGASFTLAEVARATGGTLVGGAEVAVCGVSTDSRAVRAGELFVPLRGERFDGHAFLPAVRTGGAAAALVAEDADLGAVRGFPVVRVADTLRALGDLARFHRDRWGGTVVGIGGSAGKTTTKELTAAALAADGRTVHRTRGNLNNQIGVPMTLFELTADVRTAVVEMGTNARGEVARLVEIARPDVGVVTLIAPEHLEGLGSLANVAEEEAALLVGLDAGGVAVANGDMTLLAPWLSRVRAKTVWRYGTGEDADLRLVSHSVDESLRTEIVLRFRADGREVRGAISLLGSGAAMNAAAAVSVAHLLGRDAAAALLAVAAVAPTEGRMRPRTGARGVLILDDTYNANPRSMDLAIETASEVARRRGARVVAFLGAMGELGAQSREHHVLLGERVAAHGVSVFIGAGEEMGPAVSLAAELGVPVADWVRDSADAAARAPGLLHDGDVVLVKGSRSTRMERVVEALVPGASAGPAGGHA